jgi:transposase InsO family protein
MTQAERDINRKLRVLNYAKVSSNVSKTCRHFGISREIFYRWKRAYESRGEDSLINSKPCPQNIKLRTPKEIEEKVIYLRKTYHLGPARIKWFLERYHGMKISSSGAYWVLKRNGMSRLPRNTKLRTVQTHQRYEKQVPGHHIQMDVKFLFFTAKDGKKIRRFQYTAIDDATRVRAMQIYLRHTQENAISFIDHVIDKFPFRINTVRTDNGHEFQALFHWHCYDRGIHHVYIRPRTPRLNGKVERSHRTDDLEFYQLLDYTDDVDLNDKLKEWENYYNFDRPHGAFNGNTPYEVLRERMGTQPVSTVV